VGCELRVLEPLARRSLGVDCRVPTDNPNIRTQNEWAKPAPKIPAMLNETMKRVVIWIIVLGMVLSLTVGLLSLVFSS
jgi:hypothetical protein